MSDLIDLDALRDRARELVRLALASGADAADVVVAASRSNGVQVRDGVLVDAEASENDAFSLRTFVGQRSAAIAANRGGDPAALAERAVAMARVSPEDAYSGLAPQDRLATDWPDLDLHDATRLDRSQMEQRALACEAGALAVEGVARSSSATFGQGASGAVLATSHGFEGAYLSSRFSLSVSAIAGEGDSMERDYDFDSQRHLDDLEDAGSIGHRAGERAASKRDPRGIQTGRFPVLFDPRTARGLVGHLSGAMNGASVARGTSLFRDRIGETVAASGVTIVDEPLRRRGIASRPFDGEGMAIGDLTMIEDGVLRAYWLDCASARELGMEPNARGNRSGSSTSPSSTNTLLRPGNRSPEEIMRDFGTGLLVTEMIGHGANLVTGDYSRGASGYWIENGEPAYPVTEITLAGNLLDMFAAMEPASDLETGHGTDSPSILVEGLTLAGR